MTAVQTQEEQSTHLNSLVKRVRNIDLTQHGHKIVGIAAATASFIGANYSLNFIDSGMVAVATGSVATTLTALAQKAFTYVKEDKPMSASNAQYWMAAGALIAFLPINTHFHMVNSIETKLELESASKSEISAPAPTNP